MKYYHKVALLLLMLSTLGGGCDKFVDLGLPVTAFDAADLSKEEEASSALTACYVAMVTNQSSSYYTALLAGLSADELHNPSPEVSDFYMNDISISSKPNENYWLSAYNMIYRVNEIYEACYSSATQTTEVKKQLMAEALFVRAYCYFYLVNLYGNVPLVLTTDYRKNVVMERTPADLVYAQIVKDLKAAKNELHAAYVGTNNIPPSSERIRPNRATAGALLARVYLYQGKYAEAEHEATLIIDDPMYELATPQSVFLKNSKEAIWQLYPATADAQHLNTVEAENFILSGNPDQPGKLLLNKELLAAFEEGDLRRLSWIGVFSVPMPSDTVYYYYPYKYKVKQGDAVTEYTTVLRLAEQYLIRAEARAYQNKFWEAISDLNVIRKRAGISLLNASIDMGLMDLLKIILKERQTELFTEQGHRWFDLKRTGNLEPVMGRVIVQKGGTWKPGRELWPIPERDVRLGDNVEQNFGY